ncbi:uncharacterized protein LOC136071818 isoform X2 [Hydra vulgaris]|uniref:Uncharacterized protein LOC136071818 isoform X2 n=1 Tax=Hydra vulgaris TaxID=6087 RepID=A0ABM4BVS1_HYDVU
MDSVLKISELLYERSLEATQSVGELLLSVKKAKAACSIFTDTCLSHENWPDLKIFLSHQSNMLNEQEPNSQMLVSVSSLLKEDGTFHCRLIDNFTYNEKLLNDISNKLWWEIKDSTAKCIQPVPLNCPIFHFSTTYNMYVRGVVVSCHESQQNKYSVSYLDFGCTLNVNAETQFFLLPNEFQNQLKYPYQSLHCTLFDSSIKVSNVVQQKFSELTTNRVLKIEIKCTVTIANTSYLLVELRTIPDNLIVNYEITKIVKENVDEMVQNEEEPWCGDVFEGKTQNGILTEQSLNTKTKSYENLSLQTEHSQRLNSKPNFVIDQKLFRRCLKENIEFNDSMQHNGLHAGSSNQIGFDSFCETVTVEDMVNSGCNEEFFPRAILQRPPTIGYYDPYGTWFPETPIANMYINSNEVLNESHNSLSFKSNIENDITNNHITNVNFSDCSREINQDVRISNCGDLQNNMENTSCGNTSDNVEKELEKLLSSSDENH